MGVEWAAMRIILNIRVNNNNNNSVEAWIMVYSTTIAGVPRSHNLV